MNASPKTAGLVKVFSSLQAETLEVALFTLTTTWPFKHAVSVPRKIPLNVKLEVFVRDQFQCRYCGKQTVHLGPLRLLSHLFPQEFPYHPHWRREATHPAYWEISTSCDHLIPVARGGSNVLENLVTSCYQCNAQKGDWLLEECHMVLRDSSPSPWDGLVKNFVHVMTEQSIQEKDLKRYFSEAEQILRLFGKD